QAQRSGTGRSALLSSKVNTAEVDMNVYRTEIDHYCLPLAADVEKSYSASENVDALITKAKEDMERAAKSLDFLAAARFRDRMYELQKLKEKR
ncbi:MAG: UvrB/UvrC motif-containing protein, partial [Alistipes sp.]